MSKKQNIFFPVILLLASIFFAMYSYFSSNFDSIATNVAKLNLSPASSQLAAIDGAGSGLIDWWKFDDGSDYSQTGKDSAGNNSGTLAGGATWTADNKIGGGAVKFDGAGGYVQYSGTMSNVQTISYWIKANSLDEMVADLGNGLFVRGNGFLSGLGDFNSTTYIDGVKESLGPELVTNGDIESGSPPTGWTYSHGCAGTTVDDERSGGTGQHSIDITSTDQTWVSLIPGVRLVSGKVYRAVSWMKAKEGSGSTVGTIFADSTDKAIAYSPYSGTAWQKSTVNFAAAASGSTSGLLTINGPVTREGRFDDVSIKEVTSTISPGQWHHVVIVVDSPISVTNMTLGKSNSKYMNGSFDDVRIYNRTLSSSEIQELYNYNPGNAAPAAPANQTSSSASDPNAVSAPAIPVAPVALANTGNYYVDSTNGNDSNNGASPDFAWKTLLKVNNSSFKPGDHILLKRGSVWRWPLNVSSSGTTNNPITFDAYGTGAAPIIYGTDIVTGWTQYSDNIYVANVGTISAPTQLYVDGIFYDIARYPNSGYLKASANSISSNTIIDSSLSLTTDQVLDATVKTRAVSWYITTTKATDFNSTSKTITLNKNVYDAYVVGDVTMKAGFGYYLENKLWMLDHAGEWLYDASAGKLYLWAPNNDNPVNHTVELSTRQYGIQIVGKNYVTIQNLGVKNANQYDVSVSNADNITLSHLNISGGLMGVYSTGVTNYLVRNNTIENTLSNGIHVVSNSSNIDISNNNINNAGNVGISPKQSDGGINVQGISINIHDNAVTNSGYIGIQFEGDHDVVENNLIDNSCLVLDDCGGVYTYPMGYKVTGNSIIGNTIKNTIGNFEGTPKTVPQAIGIYLDDLSYNVKVLNNSIYNADRGIFVHSGYSNTITGNAIYGSRTLGLVISEDGGGSFAKTSNSPGTVHDNVVIGNRIENLSTGPTVSYYSVINGNPLNFGTYNNNQYCHPNSNLMISNASKNYTLGDWQKFSGQDLNSTDVKSYCDKTPIIPVNASSIRQTNEAPANPIYVQVNSPSAPPNVATQAVVQQNVLNSNPKPLVYPDTSVVNTKLNTSAKTFSAKPTAFKTITNLDNSLLTIPTTTIDIVVPKVPSWIEVLVDLFKEIVSRIKMGAGKTMLEIRGLVMVRQTITTK